MPISVAITTDRRDKSPTTITKKIRPSRPEVFIKEILVERVARSGAFPLLIPPSSIDVENYCSWICAHADGIIISGGAFDIDPSYYGEEVRGRIDRRDEDRTQLELCLARMALKRNIPLLGICGGMQVMAVALGGKLIQDIATFNPQALEHEQPTDPAKPWHNVSLSGIFREIYQRDSIMVNSTHHQAVLPHEKYSVAGIADDGIIEAIVVHDHTFALGVQWHPELLRDSLFSYFTKIIENRE